MGWRILGMAKLVRFGVSMEPELLKAFDKLIARKGYANRSEAIRDLARESLVRTESRTGKEKTCGALCLIYDPHQHGIARKLTRFQQQAPSEIVSTLSVHLDSNNCMEVMVMRGLAKDLQTLADKMTATRGVKHGRLTMATTGSKLK
jgi:CopG family nickel-responsive transcriptional regulator